MENLWSIIVHWWPVVTSVIACASAIAALTPSQTDNEIVNFLNKIIDRAALNVGKSKDLRADEEE